MHRPHPRGGGGARRTVVVVDDDVVVRRRVAQELRASRGLTLIGEAASLDAGLTLIARRPALATVELALPQALDVIRAAAQRGVLVVVLTRVEDDDLLFRAFEAGAIGCLAKSDPHARLVDALESALSGGTPVSPRIARRMLWPLLRPRQGPRGTLTPRETQVVELFARGATYEDVARALSISVNTVRHHVRSMYRKLDVASKAELVARVLDARTGPDRERRRA